MTALAMPPIVNETGVSPIMSARSWSKEEATREMRSERPILMANSTVRAPMPPLRVSSKVECLSNSPTIRPR